MLTFDFPDGCLCVHMCIFTRASGCMCECVCTLTMSFHGFQVSALKIGRLRFDARPFSLCGPQFPSIVTSCDHPVLPVLAQSAPSTYVEACPEHTISGISPSVLLLCKNC